MRIWKLAFSTFLAAGCAAPSPYPLAAVAAAGGPPNVSAPLGQATDTTPPIQAMLEPILGLEFEGSKLRLRVPSSKCTQQADFRVRTRRSDMANGSVQLALTRVRSDACPQLAAGSKLFEYDLGELGLRAGESVRMLNPFAAGSASTPSPAPGVRLDVEPPNAAPGSEVTLVLSNGSPYRVGYNLCNNGLEHRRDDSWNPIARGGGCQRILYSIGPGREARYRTRLPATLAEGKYRFRTNVDLHVDAPGKTVSHGGGTVYTKSFQVNR